MILVSLLAIPMRDRRAGVRHQRAPAREDHRQNGQNELGVMPPH
jgi:hypothetical protein